MTLFHLCSHRFWQSTFIIDLWWYLKDLCFLKDTSLAAQLSLTSSLVGRHNVRSSIVMKPRPAVEPRRLNTFFSAQASLSRMNVVGIEKSWAELEQAELVMECIATLVLCKFKTF